MSSFIFPGDSKVKVNDFTKPRPIYFTGAGVSVAEDVNNNRFTITVAGSGSINSASNVGDGEGQIFKQLNDDDLEFKTIKAGTNIIVTNNANDITIAAAGSVGEANTTSNAGLEGVGIVLAKDGINLPFKSIAAGSSKVTVSDDIGNKTVDIDVAEANLTLANLSGTIGNSKISDLAYSKLTSVPTEFAPSDHKANHVSGGGDAFAKNDVLLAAGSYLDDIADPASDAQRIWLEDGGDDIRYWSDEVTPVKHSVASASNTITFTNKTYDADATGNVLTNVENDNIKAAAGIAYSKLNLSNSIVAGDITSNAITTAKILDANVTLDKLASNSVNSAKIVDGSIVNDDVNASAALAVSKLAIGTAGQYLKVNSGGTAAAWLNEQMPFSYIIYNSGSDYIAFNTVTKLEQFSNTAAVTTFNSVLDAMNIAGGGIAFVKNGLYPISAAILTKHFTGLVGEDMEKTILRSTTNTSDNSVFRYWAGESSTLLEHFVLKNLKIEINNLNGNNTGESETAWSSSGTKNCTAENVWVKSFSEPLTPKIGFFIDTANNTNLNENFTVKGCRFEGDCGGQDFLGCGGLVDCDFSGNLFLNNTSQAIGIGKTTTSLISNNRFINTGNAIGYEHICEYNIISDNILYNTDGIKISQENSSNTNTSRNNTVSNNTIIYGLGGIEAGISIDDVITNNTFFRTERNAIRGSFIRALIDGNRITDTNFNNHSQSINSVSRTVGGIVMMNNSIPIPDSDFNTVSNNVLIDTGASFTDPISGLSKNGHTGPIILDTNYHGTYILNNRFVGLVTGPVIDNGTETTYNIPPYYRAKKWITMEHEMFYGNSSTAPFATVTSGTSATIDTDIPNETGHAGIWELDPGTDTTGRAAIGNNTAGAGGFTINEGEITYILIARLDVLSNGTDRYEDIFGLADYYYSSSTNFDNGVFFRYKDDVNSGKWQAVCMASEIETAVDTGITADTSWHTFKIVINAAGTSAAFYIDGTQVSNSPITTNIPTGVSRAPYPIASMAKSLGTGEPVTFLDYIGVFQLLTTERFV